MEDEAAILRRKLEQYERLRRAVSDETFVRELDRMIEEARQQLAAIEHQF